MTQLCDRRPVLGREHAPVGMDGDIQQHRPGPGTDAAHKRFVVEAPCSARIEVEGHLLRACLPPADAVSRPA
jgi:hypothetical protein